MELLKDFLADKLIGMNDILSYAPFVYKHYNKNYMSLKRQIHHLLNGKQKSISSATIVLAVTFALSAILGFLRSRFLYSRFFTCCVQELDAYNAAFRLPDLVFKLLVSGALSASFIPVFASYLHQDKNKANQIASTVINLLFLVFIFICLVLYLYARPLSGLVAKGFSPDQLDLMARLSRVLLLAQIFFLVSNFFTAILQVKQHFVIPALSPLVYNLFIILSIFTLTPHFGIQGVVYGAVIGAFFHFLIQFPLVRRSGFNYSLIIRYRLSGVREIIRLMIPRTIAIGLSDIQNAIVNLYFASTLSSGSISLFDLAYQIINLPSRIFATTVGQASLPILSRAVAQNNLDRFRRIVNRALIQSLYIATPIAILILVQRLTIIRLAFGARQFPWSASIQTAKILAFLLPIIVCQTITQILIRAFYAIHNTKTPLYISLVSLFFNLLANFYLINYTNLGILGLSLAVSIREVVQCFGLLAMFIRAVDGLDWNSFFSKLLKIFVTSSLSGFCAWGLIKILDFSIFNTSRAIPLVILFFVSSLIFILIYLNLSRLFHTNDDFDYRYYLKQFKRFLS